MDVAREELEREIVTRVAEAVARFGVAGDVRVDGDDVVLEGYGPTVVVPLGSSPGEWGALAPEIRLRRCNDIARRLVGERRASSAPPPRQQRGLGPGWLAPAAITLTAIAAVYGVWHLLAPGPPGAAPASQAPAAPVSSAARAEHLRTERAERVCNEARSRAVRGSTLGPTDVEGWVVEIGLLRPGNTPDLVFDPGLSSFVERAPGKRTGRFAWNGAPALGALSGPDTEVEIDDASVPADQPAWRGVTLTFRGRYAARYFHDDQRPDFVRIASTLAERLGATYAGLYARCDGGATHHVGSWFEGPGPGGATTAMMYFMGLFADTSQRLNALLDTDAGPTAARAAALGKIADATQDLRRERVATLLGTYGGMIAGRADGPSYVTFPFRDSNRAARASLGLAETLGLVRAP